MTDADLFDALRDCYDPVLRRNIVDLNLVRTAHLTLDEDAPGANIAGLPAKYRAEVQLAAISSDEVAAAQLIAQVSNRLAGLPTISRASVTLLPPAFPILNTRAK